MAIKYKAVNIQLGDITKQSPILHHLAKEGKVKIVAAKYDLDDGKVTLLETGKH